MRLWVTDRWEAFKGPIKTMASCVDVREVNGENALTITCLASLEKGDRIVWQDKKGRWRENIVDGVTEERARAGIVYTYYCPSSAQVELSGDYLEDKRPLDTTASVAMASALSASRWTVGDVADLGQGGTNFYHTNAWAAIHDVADTWGGELEFEIEVSGSKVTARRVNLRERVGADTGKRFTYTKDLVSVRREVDEGNVVTALYGYGKAPESTDEDGNLTGGYERKLTFGDVNGGQNWVGDADALARWGRPDGKGGKSHVFGDVEFEGCEDKSELLALTKDELGNRCTPKVSYEVDAISLARAGEGFEGADEGDTVLVIDKVYDPPLRVQARITKIEEDELTEGKATYTIGNFQTVGEVMAAQRSNISKATSNLRRTITNAVNASNAASSTKWGASLTDTKEYLEAFTSDSVAGAKDYTEQIAEELDAALKEYAENGDSTLEDLLKKYTDDGMLDLEEVLKLYTNTKVEQSEEVLRAIDEANKQYLEGITDALDTALDAATNAIDALEANLAKVPDDIQEQIIEMLNAELNTTGGWVYEEPGKGIMVYDAQPAYATKCVKIGGGVIGVANSKNSAGNWVFSTAIDGDGIAAERLTGRVLIGNNSYLNLESGDVYLRSGNILITDGNGNKVYINATNGFQVRDKSNRIIAGTVLMSDGTSMFRCNMVGTSSTNYITTGTTVSGNSGASFIKGSTNYFEVEAVHAVDSPDSSSTDGCGMSTLDYGFLHANRYYRQLWLHPPVYKGYLSQPPQELYMRASGSSGGGAGYVALRNSDDDQVYIDDDRLDLDSTGTARIRAPRFAIGTDPNSGGTYGITGSRNVVLTIADNGNGGVRWTYGTVNFINGICTGWPQ
jgi:phage minor structural protein